MKKNSLYVLVFLGLAVLLVLTFISGCKDIKTNNSVPSSGKKNEKLTYGNPTVELGSYLFYDTRLSFNNTKSCGSCHNPAFAFSDGYRTSITTLGENLQHNAPSLINVTLQKYFDWADTSKTSLKKQIVRPLYNQHPVELGLNAQLQDIIVLLKKDSLYKRLFANAFSDSTELFTTSQIEQAIVSFVQTLTSFKSPYDKFIDGDDDAIAASAKKGLALFSSSRLQCASCHTPPYFTTNIKSAGKPVDSIYFNTGLYNLNGNYPSGNQGLYELSRRPEDRGRFKVPGLRNIAFTAPYMHDGSVATIDEVINNYSRGGRDITTGPNKGDGKTNPNKSSLLKGFSLTAAEKKNLIDFLYSLSDSSVLNNPAFLNPARN